MKEPPTSPKRPPILDEQSFQKLLEAAFVLQQHSERQGQNKSQPDFNATLSSIVDTHKLIQSGHFDFQTAASLVADQAQRMTGATGIAVGMAENDRLLYVAAAGIAVTDAGTIVPLASCISADCFIQGKLLQYADSSPTSSQVSQAWAVRGVKALIAAPVYQKGRVAGVLELRFAKANSFQSGDVGTAQLMAGLISEAMLHARQPEVKQPAVPKPKAPARPETGQLFDTLPPEPASPVAETHETFLPEMPATAKPAWPQGDRISRPAPLDPPALPPSEETSHAMPATSCHSCGNPLEEGEAFCGLCGTPRPGQPSRSTQSNWASLWRMQQAAAKNSGGSSTIAPEPASPDAELSAPPVSRRQDVGEHSPETVEAKGWSAAEIEASDFEKLIEAASKPSSVIKPGVVPALKAEHPSAAVFDRSVEVDQPRSSFPSVSDSVTSTHSESEALVHRTAASAETPAPQIRIVPDEPTAAMEPAASHWSSAQQARAWLEAAKGQKRSVVWLSKWWWRNRASVYVGIAAVILSVSVIMFVVSLTSANAVPSQPVASAHRRKAPPAPNLTLFEKFLVSIGLAEPPDAPAYTGNPNAQVWVDVHTALYYCPGAELYGKTPGGKRTTQHDAQQDQFEPANRKVCD